MRPAEDKHLISAKRVVNKNVETATFDIRTDRWQKSEGVWVSENGWSPIDPHSIAKVEQWVEEISRIIPTHRNVEEDHKSARARLDDQLSAVEGHKKIEIDETKDSWVDPVVEEKKEEPSLGEELEKEPWINRAKTLVGILLGTIIALFITYVNRPMEKDDSLFIQEELIKLQEGPWSAGKKIPGVGIIHLYNLSWEKADTTDTETKRVAVTLLTEFEDSSFEKVILTEKEQLRRIEEMIKSARPLLIFLPESKENTRLWVSRTGSVIIEKTKENGNLSWEFLKSKKLNNIGFLKK